MKDIVSVVASDPYLLRLRFEDGVEGSVALEEIVTFEGVFAPLSDPIEFRKASVHPELGWCAGPTEPTWIPTFFTAASLAVVNASQVRI